MALPMKFATTSPTVWGRLYGIMRLPVSPAVPVRYSTDYSSHIQGKYMQKFITKRDAKSKRKWYQPHLAEPLEPFGKKSSQKQSPAVSDVQRNRARQLSYVLYDKITHIINTGELSQEIQEKHVFITEVKMHPNFGGINVCWESDRTDAPEVDRMLMSHAGKLRSLLISYHILGKIPPISFVKSRGKHSADDVDKLLTEADYGPHYEPSNPVLKMKRQSLFNLKDNDKISTQPLRSSLESQRLQDSVMINGDISGIDLDTKHYTSPNQRLDNLTDIKHTDASHLDWFQVEGLDFRNNVYGLPVDDLMKKVLAKKGKKRPDKDSVVLYPSLNIHKDEESAKKFAAMGKGRSKYHRHKESTKVKQKRLEMDSEYLQAVLGNEEYEDVDSSPHNDRDSP